MSDAPISALAPATLPLSGTEEVPLRLVGGNARLSLASLWWQIRGTPIAQAADSGSAGGNARGANAVDWQQLRTAANQVASGANSVIGGGSRNRANGSGAAVLGGFQNEASGADSWIPGGNQATTRGQQGRGAWASGFFSSLGDAQCGEIILRRETTDASPANLTSSGAAPTASTVIVLPPNSIFRLNVLVIAQQTAGSAGTVGDCANWEFGVLVKRVGSAAISLVGGYVLNNALSEVAITLGTGFGPTLRDAAAAGWQVVFVNGGTAGSAEIRGVGETNKTIRWVARVMSVEAVA